VYKNQDLHILDEISLKIMEVIKYKPLSVNEIYQEINNDRYRILSIKEIILILTKLINLQPLPLIKFRISNDMRNVYRQ